MIPLRLPTPEEMRAELEKLANHPGSVVIIAIQQLETQNYHDVGVAWFCHNDRNAIKRAVDRARTKRKKGARMASDTQSNTDTSRHGRNPLNFESQQPTKTHFKQP